MVAGNWKMHGSVEESLALAAAVRDGLVADPIYDVVVFPPFVFLPVVVDALLNSAIAVGAQNMSDQPSGAFTGEISGAMLRNVACEYVLLGHSERRMIFNETNEDVAHKFVAAEAAGLVPVLCVGETLSQHEAGMTQQVVADQLKAVVECAGIDAFETAVIAYEPVWAIGTGQTATPLQAEAVHAFLRAEIAALDSDLATKVRILYGGSVKPDNAAALFEQPNIDGALVGGASLKAADFLAICKAAEAVEPFGC